MMHQLQLTHASNFSLSSTHLAKQLRSRRPPYFDSSQRSQPLEVSTSSSVCLFPRPLSTLFSSFSVSGLARMPQQLPVHRVTGTSRCCATHPISPDGVLRAWWVERFLGVSPPGKCSSCVFPRFWLAALEPHVRVSGAPPSSLSHSLSFSFVL
jgi:hypothetical protein